ncbi:hypothetical protein NGRA_1231 [Nosema granulosis]|uniref:Uncharacterized protein n=1 Tax=Nosema granulosis TaxID=83296 RepID=A0A9P6H1J6_9MICR|nr:hypothetical protein NGRA_1231 [Nosema granulosis]
MLFYISLIATTKSISEDDSTNIIIKDSYLPIKSIESASKNIDDLFVEEESLKSPPDIESLKDLERIDRLNSFFRTSQNFSINKILTDKKIINSSKRNISEFGGKERPFSRSSLYSHSDSSPLKSPEGKERCFKEAEKNINQENITKEGNRENSYGKYSKGRKILDKTFLMDENNKTSLLKENSNRKGYKDLTKLKEIYTKPEDLICFKQPSQKSIKTADLKGPREKVSPGNTESLPEVSFFLDLKVPIYPLCESPFLSTTPNSIISGFSLNSSDIERADSVLNNFDQDIFDNITNSGSVNKDIQSPQPENSKLKTKNSGFSTKLCIKNEFNEINFETPSKFNLLEKWSIYEGIFDNFRKDNSSAGPSFFFQFRICRCIDILERHRAHDNLISKYKFNYHVNTCRNYLSNYNKKTYMSLEDSDDNQHIQAFRTLVISLAFKYHNEDFDVFEDLTKLANLYLRKIKTPLAIYNNINIEIQRTKYYKHLIPEASVIEILINRKNVKGKLCLLRAFGLLIIINSLASKMFPGGCNILILVCKYNENKSLYTQTVKKIYKCYGRIIALKGKKSIVIALLDELGYDPTFRYLELFTPILLALDIMHPYTAMNFVKFVSRNFIKEKNIMEILIMDMYICLELILTLSILLYNDTLNHQLDADECLLVWFRYYIETFGSQLNFEDVFDCLKYMSEEIVGNNI